MDILVTRILMYAGEHSDTREVALHVWAPFEIRKNLWKCPVSFEPPIYRTASHGAGIDFIQAFVVGLRVAHIFLESTSLFGRAHWQGMLDCGLPLSREGALPNDIAPIPEPGANTGSLEVLATRALGFPDERGIERELLFTLFKPVQTDDQSYTCGFAFGSSYTAPVRYGQGADYIEAVLDALAKARATFESMRPEGWIPSEEGDLLDCADFPLKVGRSFWIVRKAAE